MSRLDARQKTSQIRSKKNFPDHRIEYMNNYMEFCFSDFNMYASSRMIKGSMRLGANYDIREVLKQVGVHLQTDAKIDVQ